MTTILVLNGPNLDRLGKRQPDVYGTSTLADVQKLMDEAAADYGFTIDMRQSNYEGQLIEWVHDAADQGQFVIINPGGLTHTSISLRDAMAEIADGAGFIEVHISDIAEREDFRKLSYLEDIAAGRVIGKGIQGYAEAVHLAAKLGLK